MPFSSLRPKKRSALRWAQRRSTSPTWPTLFLKATSRSPSRVTRTGTPSASGISSVRRNGYPVAAHQRAHLRSGTDVGQPFVIQLRSAWRPPSEAFSVSLDAARLGRYGAPVNRAACQTVPAGVVLPTLPPGALWELASSPTPPAEGASALPVGGPSPAAQARRPLPQGERWVARLRAKVRASFSMTSPHSTPPVHPHPNPLPSRERGPGTIPTPVPGLGGCALKRGPAQDGSTGSP